MSVQRYEVIDEYSVIVQFQNSDKLHFRKIFHAGTDGILCHDFETFIDYKTAIETTFEEVIND